MECHVVAFGCNDDGQLGTGAKRRQTLAIDDVSASNFPQQLDSLRAEDIAAVSCGSRHTMALTANGAVYSWGWGSMGQLGHGDLKCMNVPRKIVFFEENRLVVNYISCGGCHSAAVTTDGTLYMWGETHWGQLGLPKESDALHESLPVKCSLPESEDGEHVVQVSCGGTHTAALTNLGRVFVWGRGDSGQLGIGSAWLNDADDDGLMGVSRPHLLDGFNREKVTQVTCGAFYSAALTEQGHVYIWGKEDYGMLGIGQTSDQQTPKRVEFFDNIPALQVSCGGWHTVVVAKSGDCYAFGRGEYGRLGLGDAKSRLQPHLVKALQGTKVIQAACGGSHTLFVTSDGNIYVAGRADHGRLGLTDMKAMSVPTQLELGPIPVVQVSAGGAHSVAVMHSS
uniref:RCC1-like domain-containing protein n=1 Tax=Peronospora matthiolae TaxID=2874970 RepID=A0AAV1T328_9STRA